MEKIRVAVIGLGYVGLPLARLFATLYPVVGFDVKRERVAALMAGQDATRKYPASCCSPYCLRIFRAKGRKVCFVPPMSKIFVRVTTIL